MKITTTIEAADLREYLDVLEALGQLQRGEATIHKVEVHSEHDRLVSQVAKAASADETAKAEAEPEKPQAAPMPRRQPRAKHADAAAPQPPAQGELKIDQPAITVVDARSEPLVEEAVPDLPDEVRNTGAMRDLLVWLTEHGGVTSVDQMVRTCQALKARVPVLTKVPDVDTRVRRASEVLGLFAGKDAPAA